MNNEVRLIDANELIGRLKSHQNFYKEQAVDFADTIAATVIESCISHVNNSATIDAEPVRHGEWIETQKENVWGNMTNVLECSICKKFTVKGEGITRHCNYCPNCGAKMDGGKNNDT